MKIEIVKDVNKKCDIESLRKEVFHLQEIGPYYLNRILDGKELVLAATDKGQIIGGCYLHGFEKALFIEQVFVKEEYQNSGLKVGRKLVKSIFVNRELIEKKLGKKFSLCRMSVDNEKAKALYKKIGFKESKLNSDDLIKSMI